MTPRLCTVLMMVALFVTTAHASAWTNHTDGYVWQGYTHEWQPRYYVCYYSGSSTFGSFLQDSTAVFPATVDGCGAYGYDRTAYTRVDSAMIGGKSMLSTRVVFKGAEVYDSKTRVSTAEIQTTVAVPDGVDLTAYSTALNGYSLSACKMNGSACDAVDTLFSFFSLSVIPHMNGSVTVLVSTQRPVPADHGPSDESYLYTGEVSVQLIPASAVAAQNARNDNAAPCFIQPTPSSIPANGFIVHPTAFSVRTLSNAHSFVLENVNIVVSQAMFKGIPVCLSVDLGSEATTVVEMGYNVVATQLQYPTQMAQATLCTDGVFLECDKYGMKSGSPVVVNL